MSVGPLDSFHNLLTWPRIAVHGQTESDPQTSVFALRRAGEEEIESIRM